MLFQGQKGDELADLLQRNKTPHAFVTGYSEIKPPYDKVPLLIKPFSAEQLRLLLHHLVGPPALGLFGRKDATNDPILGRSR